MKMPAGSVVRERKFVYEQQRQREDDKHKTLIFSV